MPNSPIRLTNIKLNNVGPHAIATVDANGKFQLQKTLPQIVSFTVNIGDKRVNINEKNLLIVKDIDLDIDETMFQGKKVFIKVFITEVRDVEITNLFQHRPGDVVPFTALATFKVGDKQMREDLDLMVELTEAFFDHFLPSGE
jgi:hypothetical protein